MSSRFEAVLAAIEDLKAAGIDARLSELWHGPERVYCIVLLNVREVPGSSAGHGPSTSPPQDQRRAQGPVVMVGVGDG